MRLRVANLLELRQLQLELQAHAHDLEDRVEERTHQLDDARLEVVQRLALAAEYRDDDTHQHAQRIGHASALLATGLGLPAKTVRRVRWAAPLHDIGKLAIPDAILLKPGALTAEEREVIESHTLVGARILAGSQSELLRVAAEIALSHHERWDGNGYPNGLAGTEIPLVGRLVSVADVFDALAHRRPYKAALAGRSGGRRDLGPRRESVRPGDRRGVQDAAPPRPHRQPTGSQCGGGLATPLRGSGPPAGTGRRDTEGDRATAMTRRDPRRGRCLFDLLPP